MVLIVYSYFDEILCDWRRVKKLKLIKCLCMDCRNNVLRTY